MIFNNLFRGRAATAHALVLLDRKEKWRITLMKFAGKILGIVILLAALKVFIPSVFGISSAHAQTPGAPAPLDPTLVNTANTIWVLVAAFLVFGMQAGFTFLEAGFARKRESVNILAECIFDTCICGLLFYAVGYAFMFGQGNGFIGWGGGDLAGGTAKSWFFLQNTPATYATTGVPVLAHWIFQYAFADTTSTITSGAMVGRCGFRGDILYSIGVTGFIYPIIGHWAWGPDGWLYTMGTAGHFLPGLGQGFRDFAGSTVVHTIGGVISLAGAMVLGPRLGRVFKRDGGGMPPANNLVVAAVGGFILWFGWYGFNPGSTLSALDMQGIGRVAANTTLAACAGGIMGMYMGLWFGSTKGKFDVGLATNGFLAGLVAITCPCYWVSPTGAILIGAIAGILVYIGIELLEYLRIDDPIGAVPVHGLCGIWGTWSLGLFASGQYGVTGPTGPTDTPAVTGLFYGGGLDVLKAQIIGNLTIAVAAFVVSYIMFAILNKLPHPWKLRVEKEGEEQGLDIFEHGAEAYVLE
ncbi:ammonium transporter [Ferruginibacter albus]|uniref:ammonium transporter n=1 Tax=Ferruginibacter albus TaxID=2875540 RepID=UPI001CC7AD87|nr:ammonium transporter [Ferruginibacter albus]UAY53015.1 ammonium transporter [Ferruginibacter albus]